MNISGDEITVFNAAKNLLQEIETMKDDLKQLREDAANQGLSKERIADLIAVAKDAIADQVKRERKDAQRRRRAELEGQLSMLDEPKKREPVTRAKPKEKPPEPPHDPETGEVIEAEPELQSEGPAAGEDAATRLTDLPPVSLSPVETLVRAIAAAALADEPDLAAARRADFADDLEIPPYCDRRHEARRVPEAAE